MTLREAVLSVSAVSLLAALVLSLSPKLDVSADASAIGNSANAAEQFTSGAHQMNAPDKKLGIMATVAVVVNDVRPGTLAAKANLVPGDLILEANGKQFLSVEEFQSLVGDSPSGPLNLRVLRSVGEGCQREIYEVQVR
jgi:S1-C subfamily serine protease